MAVMTSRQTRNNRRTTSRTPGKRSASRSIFLVRPSRDPAAIERGKQLATLVRQELAVLNNKSLDEVMSHMRGRAWSS